jgi:hypothetical protein
MELMTGYEDFNKCVRKIRATINRNHFYVEKREKGSDRRRAFFSWILEDRRIRERRRVTC